MSDQQDGSKAMTVYIIACFALALVAGVAYKLLNDQREELAGTYPVRHANVVEIDRSLVPQISSYFDLQARGLISSLDDTVKLQTPQMLSIIAENLGMPDAGTRGEDHFDVNPNPEVNAKSKEYTEYTLAVSLKSVTQSQWAAFLGSIRNDPTLSRFVTVSKIVLARTDQQYAKIKISDSGRDESLWNCTLTLTWFTPKTSEETGTKTA